MERAKSMWTIPELMEEAREAGVPLRYGAIYRMVLEIGPQNRVGSTLVLDREEHKRFAAMLRERKAESSARMERAQAEANAKANPEASNG